MEENLEKKGISIVKSLDTLTINSIAKKIATLLCSSFPEQNLNYNEIFITISRLNMYVAKMPPDMAVAKYDYKNSSIYISDKMDFHHLDKCLIHECIHAIQTKRDSKNNITTLGLCNFSLSSMPGMSFNEAAVQLMAEYCVQSSRDSVKYYGIELSTISPDYYPLECALISQIAYLVGKHALFHSTLYGDSLFKDTFISLTNKKCFLAVQKNMDIMMNLEESIALLNAKMEDEKTNTKMAFKIANKIVQTKNAITDLFIRTQNLMLTTYFDQYFCRIQTSKDIENLRNKLYQYKNYIGVTEGYTFFNDYYLKMMTFLEQKYDELNGIPNLPTVYHQNKFELALHKLKKLFKREKISDNYYSNQ